MLQGIPATADSTGRVQKSDLFSEAYKQKTGSHLEKCHQGHTSLSLTVPIVGSYAGTDTLAGEWGVGDFQ